MEHDIDRTRILTTLLASDDIDWQLLDTARAKLATDLFGGHGWSASPEAAGDPRAGYVLDLFQAMELLDPREPAFAWNRAGLLCDLGQYAEGAAEFLHAASKLEAGISEGWITADEAEWVETARALAAQAFLLAGRCVVAAVVWKQLKDDEYREDIRDRIEAVAKDATATGERFDWLPHPRWQDIMT